MQLTHFDENGKAIMVDVTEKNDTVREATAKGRILVSKEVYDAIEAGTVGNGDVPGKTGVEMEALTGVSVALLTVYDMCKAIDKSMEIGEIYLCHKSGGKSGEIRNEKIDGQKARPCQN